MLPSDFSYLNTIDPSIEVELRYASTENFTGKFIDGYHDAKAVVLCADAVMALAELQMMLGYGPRAAGVRRVPADAGGFDPYPQEWWHFSYPIPEASERLDSALTESSPLRCRFLSSLEGK